MSKIEVNAIEPQCGTTLTLGANNDKITLGTGASFGGGVAAINWQTTAQSGDFGALSGRGYFVDSSSAARTVTLPASPSAGDIVAVSDYAQSSETNNITIARNGSNIQGDASNLILERNGIAMTLVYVDATKGWIVTNSGAESDRQPDPAFIVATGGTITTCGDFKIHTFTGPGTFTVTCGGNSLGSNTVDYLVAAGAGAGGSGDVAGGGGAGGYRESSGAASGCYTIGLTPQNDCVSALPVSVQGYPITVGAGGTAPTWPTSGRGGPGNNSSFSTITSTGGGGGGGNAGPPGTCNQGGTGGSGGGANFNSNTNASGNTPPVSPSQGQNGGSGFGSGPAYGGGGGGGSACAGNNGTSSAGGNGGCGAFSHITGSPVGRAGGGGGASEQPGTAGAGRAAGGNGGTPSGRTGGSGSANRASGGGGGDCGTGGNGSSGIVIIRYKYQ